MKIDDVLIEGAAELGITLTSGQTGQFLRYLDMLGLWNKKINLTSLRDERDIVVGHFLDSVSAAPLIPPASRVLDIGSGGGFPGIPLRIVSPSLRVTLLDSVHKKVMFMREVIRELGLAGIEALWGRAEDEGNGIERGSFDCVITRAVGGIPEMLELSAPYLGEGGRIILMRGRSGEEEWELAQKEIRGRFRLVERRLLRLPHGGQSRVILVAEPEGGSTA